MPHERGEKPESDPFLMNAAAAATATAAAAHKQQVKGHAWSKANQRAGTI